MTPPSQREPMNDAPPSDADAALSRSFGFEEDMDAWVRRVANAIRPPVPEELGEIGGFRLVAVVARGGQGTVYRAIEPGTGRTVAVKRLHQEGAGTSARARFDREAEVVASLRHPNIVTLLARHEIGEQRILIMEWIDGRPIDRWADALRERLASVEAIRTIVSTFATLADAVAHAHRNGVIHRDLKPSNLLVDGEGQPHVLDFGLALPFGPDVTAITQASGFLGTPSYAAPEQVASRHVDARADIHATGAMLYRSLTGSHPFDETAALPELFRQIADVDPLAPSRRVEGIGRELSLVCMKALAKEPDRRYQTMEEFAADLRRWLSNEPVLAHPTELGYVLRKSIARHRIAFALAAVAVTTLIIATVVSAMLALSLSTEREKLLDSRLEEQIAKVAAQAGAEEAMRRAREAERATESALRARDFLQRVFSAMHDAGVDGERLSVETTLGLARQELALEDRSPEIEAELRETLGAAFEGFADSTNALIEYRRAESLIVASGSVDVDLLARVRLGMGRALSTLGQARDAVAPLEASLDWFRIAGDNAHVSDALRYLATARSTTQGAQLALITADAAVEAALMAEDDLRFGSAMSTKAIILNDLGLGSDALTASRAAVDCLRERLPPTHPELGRVLHNDAFVALEAGRFQESIRSAREAIAIRLVNFGVGSPIGLGTAGILIRAMRGLGDIAGGIELGRATLEQTDWSDGIQTTQLSLGYHFLRLLEARNEPRDREEMIARSRALIDAAIISGNQSLMQRTYETLRLRCRALVRSEGNAAIEAALRAEPNHWASLSPEPLLAHGMARLAILTAANDVKALPPKALVVDVEALAASLMDLLPAEAPARLSLLILLADAREQSGDSLGALAAYRLARENAIERAGPNAAQAKSAAAAIARLSGEKPAASIDR